MTTDPHKFRKPMDADSIADRLGFGNDLYKLAVAAAGHQSAMTVDRLSWKLKKLLPRLISRLAAEIEGELIGRPCPAPTLTLEVLQEQHRDWVSQNFPGQRSDLSLIGAFEELGELAESHLKREQGIRADKDWDARGRDAVGDLVVFLAHYCSDNGWSLQDCVEEVWKAVRARNWQADPISGGERDVV